MTNWELLENELKYYGIILLNNRECQIDFLQGQTTRQGVIKTIRQLQFTINKRIKVFKSLWDDVCSLLEGECDGCEMVDFDMEKIFIHSLKDLSKLLLCFSECDGSHYEIIINKSLCKDVIMFSMEQINFLIDYKIAIDWVFRLINKLFYIKRLLTYSLYGKEKINKDIIKTARGVSGPWSNLDLPMKERVFPFGKELNERVLDKQKQRRYYKGFENYNNDGRVGEGHYWRELRNEPFSWYDRKYEDPYPSRNSLSRWASS